MRALDEQDHYEVLEVSYAARREDIERAYPIVRAAYDADSLATYSLFGAHEVEAIRERIDLAYRVLTDPSSRAAYDDQIGVSGLPLAEPAEPSVESGTPPIEVRPAVEALDTLEELEELEDEESGEFDGARLRRARMRRGIELEEISETTKINPSYLRCIEEEAFEDLPAAVYTHGFLTAYARTIGLDPQQVAKSYMARFSEARGDARRGRLLLGRH